MDLQRRRLPHVYPEGKALFITWHLRGSLPHSLYPPPGKMPGKLLCGSTDISTQPAVDRSTSSRSPSRNSWSVPCGTAPNNCNITICTHLW